MLIGMRFPKCEDYVSLSYGRKMDINYHDKVLAITSHLPHLIAYTIVGTADDLEDQTQADNCFSHRFETLLELLVLILSCKGCVFK